MLFRAYIWEKMCLMIMTKHKHKTNNFVWEMGYYSLFCKEIILITIKYAHKLGQSIPTVIYVRICFLYKNIGKNLRQNIYIRKERDKKL